MIKLETYIAGTKEKKSNRIQLLYPFKINEQWTWTGAF